MPQGLQVFTANGALAVDTSTYVIKAAARVANVSSNGSVTVSAPANTTILAAAVATGGTFPPVVTVVGDTVEWTAPAGAAGFRGDIEVLLV